MYGSTDLSKIPKIYSFIVVRKEYFGGYLFNPYLFEPIKMNHLGMRIIEMCDGSRNMHEIINEVSHEFSMETEYIKKVVSAELEELDKHFAINWLKKEDKVNSSKIEFEPFGEPDHLTAPLYVLWDITYECNLKCEHCLVSAGNKLKNELSLDEVKGIIDQLADMKIFSLTFLGGEPLMRPDFFEVLAYSSKKNFSVTFSTNGFLINDYVVEKLENIDVFTVQVSLDGLEETHNKIRGIDTSFTRAIQGTKKLVDSGIRVGISTVVNKLNLGEIDELIELSISLGAVSFKAIPVMPVGRGKDADFMSLSQQDMKNFVQDMLRRKERFADRIHLSGEETYSWLLKNKLKVTTTSQDASVSCVAGTQQVVISPTGLVFPCPFLHDFVAGDLRKESLKTIWYKSEQLSMFRNIRRNDLKGKCRDCPYIPSKCKGGCRAAAYAYSGDLYSEDPMCWYQKIER